MVNKDLNKLIVRTIDLYIEVLAYILEENDAQNLIISGYDCGKIVKKLRGDSDYEYSYILNRKNKDLLIQRINEKGNSISSDVELLNWIKENFCNNQSFSAFKSFVEREGIEGKFSVW